MQSEMPLMQCMPISQNQTAARRRPRRRGGFFHPMYLTKMDGTLTLAIICESATIPSCLNTRITAPSTWLERGLLESLLADGKVEYAFIDYRLQRPLYRYARDIRKLSAEVLDAYFEYPKGKRARRGIIRHLKGHADHMHVRFFAPQSRAAIKEYVRRHGKSTKPCRYTHASEVATASGESHEDIEYLSRTHSMESDQPAQDFAAGSKLIVGWRRPPLPGQ